MMMMTTMAMMMQLFTQSDQKCPNVAKTVKNLNAKLCHHHHHDHFMITRKMFRKSSGRVAAAAGDLL